MKRIYNKKEIAKIKIVMNMSINTKTNMKAKMDAGKTLIINLKP